MKNVILISLCILTLSFSSNAQTANGPVRQKTTMNIQAYQQSNLSAHNFLMIKEEKKGLPAGVVVAVGAVMTFAALRSDPSKEFITWGTLGGLGLMGVGVTMAINNRKGYE